MNRPMQALRLCALFAATFAATAFATRAIASRGKHVPPPALPRVESFDFDAGMKRFTGALSPRATRDLAARAEHGSALAVVIRARDVRTCEDLGRQLRALRRAYGPERTLTVWADTVPALESFVRQEHLARTVVRPLPPREVMADGRDLATPAALVATGGEVVEGVSHTLRAPNARLRSFADELGALRGGR